MQESTVTPEALVEPPTPAVGSRIATFVESTSTQVRFTGYGTFLGNVLTEETDALSRAMAMVKALTPKIKLDNGTVVYGHEVLWGSVETEEQASQFKDWVADRELVDVTPGEFAALRSAVNKEFTDYVQEIVEMINKDKHGLTPEELNNRATIFALHMCLQAFQTPQQ